MDLKHLIVAQLFCHRSNRCTCTAATQGLWKRHSRLPVNTHMFRANAANTFLARSTDPRVPKSLDARIVIHYCVFFLMKQSFMGKCRHPESKVYPLEHFGIDRLKLWLSQTLPRCPLDCLGWSVWCFQGFPPKYNPSKHKHNPWTTDGARTAWLWC